MTLDPQRLFDPNPQQKSAALDLYGAARDLPIYSPHSHVDPALFSKPDQRFGNPVELLIQPDHYLLRMLYSQGIPYEHLLSTQNPRQLWQIFGENFHLFRATPSGLWLSHELEAVFDVQEKLNADSAGRIYDQIEAALARPEYAPRLLFKKFNIALLATTDSATDRLEHHQAIRSSGWDGRIIPTFRPDDLLNLEAAGWQENIQRLGEVSGIQVSGYSSFLQALEQRRTVFKAQGATAADFSPAQPYTEWLAPAEVEAIFQRALHGRATPQDACRFSAHLLCEMARMSVEDGLVMQLHPGVFRNHNPQVMARFGPDKGFDIPVGTEYTRGLHALLDRFGNHPNFRLLLFTLDESTYSRELAPLAGAYPGVILGPPWWFQDSWNGMHRYFEAVIETAGLYNTAGFNDDTRGFLSIPSRHDVWRRASANWLAGLQVRGIIDRNDAESMMFDLAVGLAKKAYRL